MILKIAVALSEMIIYALRLIQIIHRYRGKHITCILVVMTVEQIHRIVPPDLRHQHGMWIFFKERIGGTGITGCPGTHLAQHGISLRIGHGKVIFNLLEESPRTPVHSMFI